MMNSTTLTSSSLPSSSSFRPLPQRSFTAPEAILSTTKPDSSSNGGGNNISTACEDQCRRMNRKRPPSAVEWHSALYGSSGKAIVLLKVQSALGSKCQGPVIREGIPIVGNVELNFSKPEYVEEILLTARGFITCHHTRNSKRFIEVHENVWKADEFGQTQTCSRNDARAPSSSAQLKGIFNWPFFVTLPTHITATDGNGQFLGQLPPSYSAGDYHTGIQYELVLTIKMSHSLILSLPFIYMPSSRPPAIQRNIADLGQDDLWDVHKPFSIRGIAFGAYTVDISCTLALEKPKAYACGSTIRCVLGLESNDEKIIELLARPRAPAAAVRLCRCVADTTPSLDVKLGRLIDVLRPPCTIASTATGWRLANSEDAAQHPGVRAVARALSAAVGNGGLAKVLIGEIPIRADLTPSFSFATLSLNYEVQVLPFSATGFVAEAGEKAILFRVPVQITSDSAPTVVDHLSTTPPTSASAPSSSSSLSSASPATRHHPLPPIPLKRDLDFPIDRATMRRSHTTCTMNRRGTRPLPIRSMKSTECLNRSPLSDINVNDHSQSQSLTQYRHLNSHARSVSLRSFTRRPDRPSLPPRPNYMLTG